MGFCDDSNVLGIEQLGPEDKTERSCILLKLHSDWCISIGGVRLELVSSLVRLLYLEFEVGRFRFRLCKDHSV